jgi:hypothetical protein
MKIHIATIRHFGEYIVELMQRSGWSVYGPSQRGGSNPVSYEGFVGLELEAQKPT